MQQRWVLAADATGWALRLRLPATTARILYTPEFQVVIVLISSPVALLVALWGMTSKATLQLLKSSKQKNLFLLKPVVHRDETEFVPR
jgi:hypothetical protein